MYVQQEFAGNELENFSLKVPIPGVLMEQVPRVRFIRAHVVILRSLKNRLLFPLLRSMHATMRESVQSKPSLQVFRSWVTSLRGKWNTGNGMQSQVTFRDDEASECSMNVSLAFLRGP